MFSIASGELRDQWSNPADVLSLLLLIGGDIVQKAIAQSIGYSIRLPGRSKAEPESRRFIPAPLAPVAFSFGWVAFGFNQLLSAVGERRLMPVPENVAVVVNCANAFQRENRSWVLERLLRDHEISHPVDRGSISIRIDIFELGPFQRLEPDHVWWLGWATILAQLCLGIPPWVSHGDWGVMMIVLSGTLLAFITCALPQWREEKWGGAKLTLDRDKVVCLTRGNGHEHVMVFIGSKGSADLEMLATATVTPRRGTPIATGLLAALWVCLLLSVAALKENAWYLVGIGGLGMLQNVYAAGSARRSSTTGLQLKKFKRRETIVAKRLEQKEDSDPAVSLDGAHRDVAPLEDWVKHEAKPADMPRWLGSMRKTDGVPEWLEPLPEGSVDIVRVHGGLKELEKWVPGAGLAMLQVFFPTSLRYEDGHVRDNLNKKFWKRAWHTKTIRRNAEQARKRNERHQESEGDTV